MFIVLLEGIWPIYCITGREVMYCITGKDAIYCNTGRDVIYLLYYWQGCDVLLEMMQYTVHSVLEGMWYIVLLDRI